jgi:hypothetical protein
MSRKLQFPGGTQQVMIRLPKEQYERMMDIADIVGTARGTVQEGGGGVLENADEGAPAEKFRELGAEARTGGRMSLLVIGLCVAVLSLVFWLEDMSSDRHGNYSDDTGWDTHAAMQRWKDSLTPHQRAKFERELAPKLEAVRQNIKRLQGKS